MPAAIEAIEHFSAGLGEGSMLSITGPYGSGKSTFGVILNHLAAPRGDPGWATAYGRLQETSPDTAAGLAARRRSAGIHERGMIRCVATARLEPVAATILRAADGGARSYFGPRYGRRNFSEAGTLRRCMKGLGRGAVPDAAIVSRIMSSMASSRPVLLIIDEFGKNIEYFAAGGGDGDLFLLQELAEMSGASRAVPLHIVTMQHMAFGEYVAGTSAGRMREWAKIQGRFDDVHFSNSLEHTRAIVTACLKPNGRNEHLIMEWAVRHVGTAAEEAGIEIPADLAASCYPLHPLAVEALPELCSRYGQNDRTLLSFVSGSGPGTVARYVETERWDGDGELPAMGIDALYDYFISGSMGARPAGGAASRLVEVGTIIRDIGGLSPAEQRVLKAIGVMNLIGRSGRLRASMGIIRCVAGTEAGRAVRILESRSLITYRRHADEYRIWHGTDVNIAAKLDAWRKAGREMPYAALMKAAMEPEPVVAAKHGIKTGTLRVFKCLFEGQGLDLGTEYDGVVVYGKSDTRVPECDRPVVIARCGDVSGLCEAATEVLALRSVMDDGEVQNDWVAKSEVGERLAAAENALGAEFDRAYGAGASWSRASAGPERTVSGPASSAASEVSDAAYAGSPRMRNEMINRNHLTAQGSMALNKIMAAIIENPDRPLLGLGGWRPERAIYEAVVREYRIHRKTGSAHRLFRPRGGQLGRTWNAALTQIRGSRKAVSLAEIYETWRLPPFGLKGGVMPLLALLIIVSMRANVALYEHGSYVPRLNASLAERLVKNPQHFALKYFSKTAAREELIRATAEALDVDPGHGVLGIVSHAVGIVRALPEYAGRTKRLDKKTLAVRTAIQNAVEPDTLLFESLPKALGSGRSGKGGRDSDMLLFAAVPAPPNTATAGASIGNADARAFAAGLAGALRNLQTAFDLMMDRMLGRLLAETEMADRASLSKAAAGLLPSVSDQKMKVFLGAVSADIPDKRAWIGYVVLTLTDRPPAEWTDEHADMFENGLREAAAGFRRLAALNFSAVSGSLKGPSVMVTITHPDGREERVILPADDERVAGLAG